MADVEGPASPIASPVTQHHHHHYHHASTVDVPQQQHNNAAMTDAAPVMSDSNALQRANKRPQLSSLSLPHQGLRCKSLISLQPTTSSALAQRRLAKKRGGGKELICSALAASSSLRMGGSPIVSWKNSNDCSPRATSRGISSGGSATERLSSLDAETCVWEFQLSL